MSIEQFVHAPIGPALLRFHFSRMESKPCPPLNTPDVLERMYHNQLALEAALMELTLLVESHSDPAN
ncbi:hypothetical protein CXP47_25485 [Pseudomonas chlororaphis]|nr:hypothetical protein CXP47_25485 [Pseudomonas chlororaphis]